MNLVLSGLTWQSVLAFLDDICILGKTVTGHLDNLEEVFKRFRQYQLKLKPKKCQLFAKEIEFLGRMVSNKGVTLTDHSISTISEWTPPTCKKEVQQFLGLANFHRNHIKGFSNISEPLNRLLLKKSAFVWGEEQQLSFDQLKQSLLSPAVLAIPSTSGSFILDTDASDVAIGAQLSQVQDGVERVIAYGSFALNSCERRYCTTRKELWAIVRFTSLYRHYLLGKKFLIRTDHHSLVWLMNFKNPEGQLVRWLDRLSRFDMVIEHRAGQKHLNADSLSRRPHDSSPCTQFDGDLANLPCQGCTYCTRVQAKDDKVEGLDRDDQTGFDVRALDVGSSIGLSNEEIGDLQKEDPDLHLIYAWVVDKDIPSNASLKLSSRATKYLWLAKDLVFLENKMLFVKKDELNLLLVPRDLKLSVLEVCHDLPTSGHQGVEGTKARVGQHFYWHTMSTDVKTLVTKCLVCQQNKHKVRKGKFPLTINQAGLPLEKVHVDFIGPLPVTTRGNQHILVMVDSFTKWVEFIPLPCQEAEVTARAAINNFFTRFGCPLEIVTDQGRNFESELFKATCGVLGIHKLRTTAYRPSANGQAERMNRTLLQILRNYVNKKQSDWDDYVPLIASAIRSSVNKQTGFTPNRLMLGREVITPAELVVPRHATTKELPCEFLESLTTSFQLAHDMARKTLKAKVKKMKRDYDLRSHVRAFKVGDAVLILNTSVKKGISQKLNPIWSGPCLIVEVITPYLYRVMVKNDKTTVMNHDRIIKCDANPLPQWIVKKQSTLASGNEVTYCICKLPDDGRPMVQCNHCFEWFHLHCVSLSLKAARALVDYICPKCNH